MGEIAKFGMREMDLCCIPRKMSVSAYFTLLTLILGLGWGRLYKGDRWGMDDGSGICQQHIHPVSNSNGIQMQIWEGCLGFEYIDCITLC